MNQESPVNEPILPAADAPQGPDTEALTPERLQAATDQVQAIRAEIQKAVVGQDQVIDQVLTALLAGGHVLLEGVPGLGKTLLVRALAKTFEGEHARVQFTPDLMPSDVLGHLLYDMQKGQFKIRRGPIFTNILLGDEINRAPAKTQSAMLEAMQERQVTLEGRPMPLPEPFIALATQNPVEQEGTYPLPEAQLDRFLLKVRIDYPKREREVELVRTVIDGKVGDGFDLSKVQPVTSAKAILELQQVVAAIGVDQAVVQYAVDLVRATRKWPGIMMGAGPRGTISLLRTARAAALLAGRDFVIPDDIVGIAAPVLRHRLILSPDMEIEGKTSDHAITDLLQQVEAPRS